MEKGHKHSILANDKKRKNWLHNRDFQVSAFCVAIGAVSWFGYLKRNISNRHLLEVVRSSTNVHFVLSDKKKFLPHTANGVIFPKPSLIYPFLPSFSCD